MGRAMHAERLGDVMERVVLPAHECCCIVVQPRYLIRKTEDVVPTDGRVDGNIECF